MNKPKQDEPLKDLEAFIAILTDRQRILAGGTEYEAWASDLMQLCLKHRGIFASGGVLVPQLGESAGDQLPFEVAAKVFEIDKNKLSSLLQQFWENKTLEAQSVSFGLSNSMENLMCIFSPVSYGFDRPIGYFWALVAESAHHKAKRILHYVSILTSLCVRAEKACHAIRRLSEPIWQKIDSINTIARYAVDLCREALLCRAAIVWGINKREKLLFKISSSGEGCEDIKVDIPLNKGIASRCAMEGKTLIFDDLWKEPNVAHPDVVHEKEFRSGIFLPLDAGGEIVGVLAAYGSRPNAFSELDINIASSVAQWLVTRFIQQRRIEEAALVEKKIDAEMPLIEAGTLAMERVHDVRNKLYFAQNELSMITSRFYHKQKDSATYKEAISASRHIDDALKIISALVRRSKLTKQNLKEQSLTELIRVVLKTMENQRKEKNVIIIFNPEIDIRLKFDRSLIERVFLNLLDNSLHFLSQISGKREIRINITSLEKTAHIIFRDNGPGIAPYDIKDVFDVFYTTKGDRGMGFGLAIAKRIIEEHGGTITVLSVWGEYTEFHINLPKN